MSGKHAIDTNILVYVYAGQDEASAAAEERALAVETNRKAAIAQALLRRPLSVSVQVFNEFSNVALRKLGFTIQELKTVLRWVRGMDTVDVLPITWETTELAHHIVETERFGFYDSLIIAAALLSDCTVLFTEDMQHGRKIANRLLIQNPFIV